MGLCQGDEAWKMHQRFWARLVRRFDIGDRKCSVPGPPLACDQLWLTKPRPHLLSETWPVIYPAASPTLRSGACKCLQAACTSLRRHASPPPRHHLAATGPALLRPSSTPARSSGSHGKETLDTVVGASLLKSIRKSLLPMLRGSFPCGLNPSHMLSTR